jgi:SAM-dependent methyltransferase
MHERSQHNLADLLEEERAEYDLRYSQVTEADYHVPDHILPKKELKWWDRYVGGLAGKSVLECGAGDGYHAAWLAKQGADVIAAELSPVGVSKIRDRATYHGLQDRLRPICVDCCELDNLILPNSIDIVLGFSVLHHLPPDRFGAVLAKILKPGGRAVFLENSNANPLYRFARKIRNNESACGAPLDGQEVDVLIALVGGGEKIFPRFGLFSLTKKYVFRQSRAFAACVEGIDEIIDHIPGSRRFSAHMWVALYKRTDKHP